MGEMQAGRELDALVAEKVMGLVRCTSAYAHGPDGWDGRYCYAEPDSPDHGGEVPAYSTDIAAAWEVVEKMRAEFSWTIEDGEGSQVYAKFWQGDHDYAITADTAPHAICLAALRAAGSSSGETA